jgi:hypothetical protein
LHALTDAWAVSLLLSFLVDPDAGGVPDRPVSGDKRPKGECRDVSDAVIQPITTEPGIIAFQKRVSQPFPHRMSLGSSWTATHNVLAICTKRLLPRRSREYMLHLARGHSNGTVKAVSD